MKAVTCLELGPLLGLKPVGTFALSQSLLKIGTLLHKMSFIKTGVAETIIPIKKVIGNLTLKHFEQGIRRRFP